MVRAFFLLAMLCICIFKHISAADVCSGELYCSERRSNCSGSLLTPLRTGCSLGLACFKGQCVNPEDLAGFSCNKHEECASNIFPLRCIANTCKFFGFAGPGEICRGDYECYIPKGAKTNVKCFSGRCQSGQENDPCFIEDARSCLPGLYCDTKNTTCKPKMTIGEPCEYGNECADHLFCSDRGGQSKACLAPMKDIDENDACDDSGRFCKSDLYCVSGICRTLKSQGTPCDTASHSDPKCDYGLSACQCNPLQQSLQCEINPMASPHCDYEIQELKNCMTENKCTIEFPYDHFLEAPPASCINEYCRSQLGLFYQCRMRVLYPTTEWAEISAECGGWFYEYKPYQALPRNFQIFGSIVALFVFIMCTICAVGISQFKKRKEYGLVSQFESQRIVDSDEDDFHDGDSSFDRF